MSEARPEKGGWLIVTLLFFFMLINFVDKVVIGLAGVPIMKELGLTPKEFGLINSSFFFLFSLSAIATGFLVNRVPAKWVLLVMALIWALTQFPMLGTVSFGTLIGCRVALGAGEGPAYPVALHATYKWFPDKLRALPTAVIAQGAAVGVVLAVPLLDRVIEEWTWHAAFGVLGVAGLIWVAAWAVLGREGSITDPVASEDGLRFDRVPYARLLFNPTMIAVWASGFGAYWGLSLLIGWFTPYLIQGLHFTQREASWITTLPWAAGPVIVPTAGYISQRMLAAGVSTRYARGVFAGSGVALGGLALIAMPWLASPAARIAMMIAGISVPAVVYVLGHAIVAEITPASQRGAMLAINNAIATSAGLLGPYIMGSVVQDALAAGATAAEGYQHGFMICGMVALICGLFGIVFLRPQAELARFAARSSAAAIAAGD